MFPYYGINTEHFPKIPVLRGKSCIVLLDNDVKQVEGKIEAVKATGRTDPYEFKDTVEVKRMQAEVGIAGKNSNALGESERFENGKHGLDDHDETGFSEDLGDGCKVLLVNQIKVIKNEMLTPKLKSTLRKNALFNKSSQVVKMEKPLAVQKDLTKAKPIISKRTNKENSVHIEKKIKAERIDK